MRKQHGRKHKMGGWESSSEKEEWGKRGGEERKEGKNVTRISVMNTLIQSN